MGRPPARSGGRSNGGASCCSGVWVGFSEGSRCDRERARSCEALVLPEASRGALVFPDGAGSFWAPVFLG